MEKVKAGQPLIDCIKLCYSANRPLLISGHHGIGKSELVKQAAHEIGIGFISRDLSLMEPPDLTGLPKARGDSTVYLPPAFLPRQGQGLLVFEELNRCERFMRAPCLQLLTERSLNDYRLPDGWLPMAAINPSDDDYEVAELDPALVSRFTCIHVVPDRKEWLAWARGAVVHSSVISYVQSDSSVFNMPKSNPRAWAYVSDLMHAHERRPAPLATLRASVIGVVGSNRGAAFLKTLKDTQRPFGADEILKGYSRHRHAVQRWVDNKRIDLLEPTLQNLLKFLQPGADYQKVRDASRQWNNAARFLADLPPDLRQQAREWFESCEYEFPVQKTTCRERKT